MHTLSDIERQRVRIALVEDLGKGDVTSLATVREDAQGTGQFIAKASGILAGLDLARQAFLIFETQTGIASPIFEFKETQRDGAMLKKGESIASVRANLRTLLAVERVALNLMQRMSGIASMTHAFVEAVRGTDAIILDTRKTAPLLRPFDRYAVHVGGGMYNRSSLSAMVLVKDNHIAANRGDVAQVIEHLREYFKDPKHELVPIEIEVTSLEQFAVVLTKGKGLINRVMFDNFELGKIREAVKMNAGTFETEASGGITLATVRAVAETGVNFISVGALTHSVTGLDISFEVLPS
ncbi:MAG: carboxylating nicotinate-nucleotide diphosphorylase [Bacteroidota bacterium]|nr:carboxylating nicotinate-nucleotide diphosphorylase [Bacteroidota bacterium]